MRERLGAFGRALTATALKPMGLPPERMAALAHSFAVAGIDASERDRPQLPTADDLETLSSNPAVEAFIRV